MASSLPTLTARRCIIARRLIERGVRFVQLFINGQIWDNHTYLARDMKAACERTDKPIAALVKDLKQRGLLKDTLVVWGGEFGRHAYRTDGKRHGDRRARPQHQCLHALDGRRRVKPGIVYGSTDELGHQAVENKVSVTDWHATILHQLGLDYQRLVFDQNGLKDKLTSVFDCRVVKEILV